MIYVSSICRCMSCHVIMSGVKDIEYAKIHNEYHSRRVVEFRWYLVGTKAHHLLIPRVKPSRVNPINVSNRL